MKKQVLLLAAAALAFAAVSCQQPAPADSLVLSSDKTVNAPCEGGSYDVVFTTNVEWTAQYGPNAEDIFFLLDKSAGKAGTATLKLNVEKNETYNSRIGTVTIQAGSLSETITVKQAPLGETSEEVTQTVPFAGMEFTVPVKSAPTSIVFNDDAKGWVEVEEGATEVKFKVGQNDTGGKRTGHVDIVIIKHTIHVTIEQNPETGELTNPKVTFLGRKQNFYSGSYATFRQFLLSFDSEIGKVYLVINENPAEGTVDKTTVATGTYSEDAGGTHADKTFTLGGDKIVTYYTVGEKAVPVVGGEIVIAKSGNDYDLKATLVNEANLQKVFTYKGALPAAEDESFDGYIDGGNATYSNQNTFFTGKKWEWTVTLFYTSDPAGKEDDYFPSYVTYKLYTAADSDVTEFPTGVFTYEEPATDETVTYPSGKLNPKVSTFTFSGNDIPQHPLRVNADKVVPTLTITKTADGKYTFALKSNVTMYTDYNATEVLVGPFDWNPEVTVAAPTVSAGSMGHADGDAVLDTPPAWNTTYSHMWFGDAYKTGTNVFVFNMTYINDVYNIYLTFNSATVWEAYNATAPIPAGTYTFSNSTTTAPQTIVPTRYCYIQNSYTGTTYKINGGTVILTDSDFSLNLTGKSADGKTASFIGKFNTSVMRAVNRSAERYATQVAVTPVE